MRAGHGAGTVSGANYGCEWMATTVNRDNRKARPAEKG